MSEVRFLKDPGLLIRFMVEQPEQQPVSDRVVFIPHYREREIYRRRMPNGIELVDIDAHPLDLARQILTANLVYSSSLHGIIFAHALNRPCVFVAPQTEEPTLKFEDYFASVDLPYRQPYADLDHARRGHAPDSPAELKYTEADFAFPSFSVLEESGIVEQQ